MITSSRRTTPGRRNRGIAGPIALTVVWVASALAAAQVSGQDAISARAAFPVPANVRVVRDVVYSRYGQRDLKVDVYLPPGAREGSRAPGVLVVRGGGWRTGDKEAFGFIAGQLAKEGFVAVSVEYRASGEAKFPAAVHDVKAAVRWMRAHAATYGIDTSAIGAIGGSAGGHLVALLATTGNLASLEGSGGNATSSSRIEAGIAMACVCNLGAGNEAVAAFIGEPLAAHRETLRLASPVTHVTRSSATLLLLHSPTDPAVAFAQSVEMQAAYRLVGAVATLRAIEAPGNHAFWNDARFFPETMRHTVDFLRANFGKRPPGANSSGGRSRYARSYALNRTLPACLP